MPLEHVQLSTACWFLHHIQEQACFCRWAISWHWISLPRNTPICPLLWEVKGKRDYLLTTTFGHDLKNRTLPKSEETNLPLFLQGQLWWQIQWNQWNQGRWGSFEIMISHGMPWLSSKATVWDSMPIEPLDTGQRNPKLIAERITVHEHAWNNSSQLWQFANQSCSHVSCSSGFDLRSQLCTAEITFHIMQIQ